MCGIGVATACVFLLVSSLLAGTSDAQNDTDAPLENSCLLLIPPAKSLTDGKFRICITDVDVNRALARASSQLQIPAGDPNTDPAVIGALGELFQATTEELLKEMVGLSPIFGSLLFPLLDITQTDLKARCPSTYVRGSGVACSGTDKFRRIDGYCTQAPRSPAHYGAAGHPIRRDLPAAYADYVSQPRVSVVGKKPLPLARTVSNAIHAKTNLHDQSLTIMFVVFGQILDHDITLTGNFAQGQGYLNTKIDCCSRPGDHRTCLPLEVPADDPFYSQFGKRCLNFVRVLPALRQNCALGQRNQFNAITPVIDASAHYGSSLAKANRLRDPNSKGKLLTFSPFSSELNRFLKPLLPQRTTDPDADCIRSDPSVFCFDAGDDRVTEQPLLTTMHLVFVRLHNDIADELAAKNRHWDSERVYQETRRIVGAILQHIVVSEYLPALLPRATLRRYRLTPVPLFRANSHDPSVDPQTSQSFSTAAFRFAHTLLPDQFIISSKTHAQIGTFPLRSLFNRPDEIRKPGRVDEFLLGALNQPADAFDQSLSDEVRDFLFQEPGQAFGMDLAARNIERGREHGVPGYTAYRKLCGLPQIRSWADMLQHFPNSTVEAFRNVYSHVADVDLWSAGISENKVAGSILGPTFACLIGEQFGRLIRGDRFWYDNPGFPSSFDQLQLAEIKKMTFSRVLCDSSDSIRTIQKNAFRLHNFVTNPRVSCCSGEIPRMSLEPWIEFTANGINPTTIDVGLGNRE